MLCIGLWLLQAVLRQKGLEEKVKERKLQIIFWSRVLYSQKKELKNLRIQQKSKFLKIDKD
jgi:hypothetical protein